jgi:hypothetical protein
LSNFEGVHQYDKNISIVGWRSQNALKLSQGDILWVDETDNNNRALGIFVVSSYLTGQMVDKKPAFK